MVILLTMPFTSSVASPSPKATPKVVAKAKATPKLKASIKPKPIPRPTLTPQVPSTPIINGSAACSYNVNLPSLTSSGNSPLCMPGQFVTLWHLPTSGSPAPDKSKNIFALVCPISKQLVLVETECPKDNATNQQTTNTTITKSTLDIYWRSVAVPSAPIITSISTPNTYEIIIHLKGASQTDSPPAFYYVKDLATNIGNYYVDDTNYSGTFYGGPGNYPRYFIKPNEIDVMHLSPNTNYKFAVSAISVDGTSVATTTEEVSTMAVPITAPGIASIITGNGYRVGDTGPGGGVVYYYSALPFTEFGSPCSGACHYLEFKDLMFGEDLTSPSNIVKQPQWSTDTSHISGASGRTLGFGFSNTQTILSPNGTYTGDQSGAAYLAHTFAGNDNSAGQWFLPSIQELVMAAEQFRPMLDTGISYLYAIHTNQESTSHDATIDDALGKIRIGSFWSSTEFPRISCGCNTLANMANLANNSPLSGLETLSIPTGGSFPIGVGTKLSNYLGVLAVRAF